MTKLGLSIALSLLAIGISTQAFAQVNYTGEGGCTKGLFWPFVRDPGDCLTDSERASGMTGTYRGSEIAAPQAPEANQAQGGTETAPVSQTAPASAAVGNSSPPSAPVSSAATAPLRAPAQQAPAPEPVDGAAEAELIPAAGDRAEYLGAGGCTKGLFWPFVRRDGDCLTDAEI